MIHQPVLLQEAVEGLIQDPNGRYVDGTFGRGGHSREILHRLSQSGQLLALDKDLEATMSEEAAQLKQDPRFSLQHRCFSGLTASLEQQDVSYKLDGILFDLGVSSPQLDQAERGFSFKADGPLDMRMNKSRGLSAAEWIATVEEKELKEVLKTYGEERFAGRIARRICEARNIEEITTTSQLATIVATSIPRREKHKHPATRTFQAIRIKLNQELDVLLEGLSQATKLLKPSGRLVVISFHSLEDRIVKRFMRDLERGEYQSRRLPKNPKDEFALKLKRIGKAVRPGDYEVANNPRARSAVLRIAEKVC